MEAATKLRGTESVPRAKSVPIVTQERIRARIAKATEGYTSGQIAQSVGCSKDTVKSWRKENGRCPHSHHLAMLSRGLPCVQEVLAEEFGISRAAASGSDDAIAQIVRRLAMGEGPDAVFCRQVIRRAEGMATEDVEPIPPIVRDAWRLHDLRELRAVEAENEKTAHLGNQPGARRA